VNLSELLLETDEQKFRLMLTDLRQLLMITRLVLLTIGIRQSATLSLATKKRADDKLKCAVAIVDIEQGGGVWQNHLVPIPTQTLVLAACHRRAVRLDV